MGTAATEILEHARPGRVSTVFCSDVVEARDQLRAAAEQLDPTPTLVALEWSQAPALAQELTEIRDALADAALSLWPDWYLTAEARFAPRASEGLLEALESRALQSGNGVSRSWLQSVFRRCQQGRRPILRSQVAAEQVRQLALALDPTQLTFALSVESPQAPRARMRGLAKAAEWLANESGAKTLLLVPSEWQGSTELDSVSYGSVWMELLGQRNGSAVALGVSRIAAEEVLRSEPSRSMLQVQVGPIAGRPHPGSAVEKLVCERLRADAELSGLFEFNQLVPAYGGKRYVVDLLWRQGGLVVELDGPEHNGQFAYVRDRDRDYRLLMSGFATLRIPNAEVYVDANAVIAKIRNVVQRVAQLKEGSRAS